MSILQRSQVNVALSAFVFCLDRGWGFLSPTVMFIRIFFLTQSK